VRRTPVVCWVALALFPALVPSCGVFEPEVGDPLPGCIDADSDPNVPVSFKDQLRPLFAGTLPAPHPRPCADCHYHSGGTMEGLQKGNLDLETLGGLRNGGHFSQGTVAIPGKPCASPILQKLRGTFEGPRMPKGGPYWSPAQIQLMSDWIFEGAIGASTD